MSESVKKTANDSKRKTFESSNEELEKVLADLNNHDHDIESQDSETPKQQKVSKEQKLKAEIQSLSNRVKQLENFEIENSDLRQQAQDAEQKAESLKKRIAKLETKLEKAQEKLDSLKEEAALREAEQKNASLEENLQDNERKLSVQKTEKAEEDALDLVESRKEPPESIQDNKVKKESIIQEIQIEQCRRVLGRDHPIRSYQPFRIVVRFNLLEIPMEEQLDVDTSAYTVQAILANRDKGNVLIRSAAADRLVPGLSNYQCKHEIAGMAPGTFLLRIYLVSLFAHTEDKMDIELTIQ